MDYKISIKSLVKKNYKYALIIIFFTILSSLLQSLPLLIIKDIVDCIDKAIRDLNNSSNLLNPLITLVAIYLIIQVLNALISNFNTYYTTLTQARIAHKIRMDVYNHLAKLDQSFFDNNDSSEILNKLVQDSQVAVNGFISPVVYISRAFFSFAFALFFMARINLKLTLVILPFALIAGLITSLSGGRFRLLAKEAREKNEKMWKYYKESIQGIRDIHALSIEKHRLLKVEDNSLAVVKNLDHSSKYAAFISVVNSLTFVMIITIMLLASGVMIINGYDISIGGVAAILMYNSILQEPVRNIVQMCIDLYKVKISLTRLNFILLTPYDLAYDYDNNIDIDISKPLKVSNLSFSYNEKKVLDNVSLEIEEGKRVALVGKSGSGKTTILKVIFGLYPKYQGKIELLGNEVNEKTKLGIRKYISYVFQDTYLFNASIKENIIFANPNYQEEELEKILKITLVDEIINKLDKGIDTLVGENGVKLSGGERQRIGIARALLANPKLLILDEATSALDNESEKRLLSNINEHYPSLAMLVVAHRLTTVKDASLIHLLDKGIILESGTHEELMKKNGKYQELYTASEKITN